MEGRQECPSTMNDLRSLVSSLADRSRPRTEAVVQADLRQLLLEAPLGLDEGRVVALEAPVEGRRRIDLQERTLS
jgi:hypothetical protein